MHMRAHAHITSHMHAGIELQVGSEVQCCILDMDLVDPHLSVSLNPKLYEACPVAKEEDTATPKRRSKREKGKTIKQTTVSAPL